MTEFVDSISELLHEYDIGYNGDNIGKGKTFVAYDERGDEMFYATLRHSLGEFDVFELGDLEIYDVGPSSDLNAHIHFYDLDDTRNGSASITLDDVLYELDRFFREDYKYIDLVRFL